MSKSHPDLEYYKIEWEQMELDLCNEIQIVLRECSGFSEHLVKPSTFYWIWANKQQRFEYKQYCADKKQKLIALTVHNIVWEHRWYDDDKEITFGALTYGLEIAFRKLEGRKLKKRRLR